MKTSEEIRDFLKELDGQVLGTEMWKRHLSQIRNDIDTKDISTFFKWHSIRKTMCSGPSEYSRKHFDYLKSRSDWNKKWSTFLSDSSMSTTINHSYYISILEDEMNINVNEVRFVFEFGAGFGSMCVLLHKMGFSGKYLIFDFPELLAIQNYYLSRNNINENSMIFSCNIEELDSKIEKSKPSMFISTHALEEAPKEVMERILKIVKNFSIFLFVFSGGRDKFERFSNDSNLKYSFQELPYIPSHYLIAGKK